jgi:hypothetical protein
MNRQIAKNAKEFWVERLGELGVMAVSMGVCGIFEGG